jgi:regulation of enolase protein 1 (concanavalin A-like superfamily)
MGQSRARYCMLMAVPIVLCMVACGGSTSAPTPTATIQPVAVSSATPSTSTPTPTPEPLCSSLLPEIEAALANTPAQEPGEPTTDQPWIMAHFMPWYEADPEGRRWGWHWTMNHFHPDLTGSDGQRDIASHFYPLTGPYDSRDPSILEYQTLLMKLSGIDGVIVNWYSHENVGDWPLSNQASHEIFNWIEKAGLSFALCYADDTVRNMVDGGYIEPESMVSRMQEALLYAQRNWFQEDAYATLEGKPILLTFPSNAFDKDSEWSEAFSVLDPEPMYFTLHAKHASFAAGAYNWLPMYESVGGVLSWRAMVREIDDFYRRSRYWEYHIAGAWPGNEDIYSQAGVGPSFGYLDPRDGETFAATLERAFASNPIIVQLATWNDYGEGTIIEPTIEFGYKYLEMVQDARREWVDADFPFSAEDLHLPLRLYNLRNSLKDIEDATSLMNMVSELIILGNTDLADAVLSCMEQSALEPAPTPESNSVSELKVEDLIFQDDFEGSLKAAWEWINQDPSLWSLQDEPGMLRVQLSPTGGQGLSYLLQDAPSGDFDFVTKVDFNPSTNFQRAGLAIWVDERNAIGFVRGFCDLSYCAQDGLAYFQQYDWTPSDPNFPTRIPDTDTIYLRISVVDEQMAATYSLDSTTWTIVGTHQRPGKPFKIGLMFGQSSEPIYADFDSFSIFRAD